MSKKKKKATSKPTEPPPSPAREWTAAVGIVLAGAVAYTLVCGFTSVVSPVIAGLLAGAFVGMGGLSKGRSAVAGGAAGLLGGAFSAALFAEEAVVRALNSMPSYANPDVIASLYTDSVYPLLRGNIVNSPALGGAGVWALVVIAVVATGAAAYGAAAVRRMSIGGVGAGTVVAWAAVTLLALAFFATASTYGASFKANISEEPADNAYAYDGYISLRAYYEMGKGQTYYQSLVRAASGDSRLIEEKAVVDGKFRAWAFSPSFIRLPYAFYLWRLVSPGDGGGIFVFSLITCAAILVLAYWAFSLHLGEKALLVPLLLFPNLLLSTMWANILMPDWWAGLAGLAAMLLVVRGRFVPAAILALAAALFREVMAIELAILLAGMLWLYFRKREREHGLAAALSAVLLGVFAGAYVLHYRSGAEYIAVNVAGMTPVSMLQLSAKRALVAKFVSPASYMMFGYGYFALPGWVFLLAQLPGFAWATRTRPDARLVCMLYAAFWLVFTFLIGGSSSYWGQLYMPFALVGTAALLADPDGLSDRVARWVRSWGRTA